ncbi:fibrinogen-binding MSCRAMM adhesin Fss2 [Enterococcus faecalis]|uniref:fibrinogen-binding MSCRAMM adhesin Fss2 n=3 Tax=Enterococcus faecalis TaxID=1351 RepID=UPI0007668043|nr:fibrinogen-binding MSCRAMM adhesin Fss2 [Enterococcus faecalis]EGO2627605.1 fibrinogen-binding MSCRAMM adhesin Fss2 [Enterococcus faecalis]EGO2649475.1 fibrinogen-binding MSCRAMM adhesin Fss2 [Enterococcus faecalis]EGO5161637.1 fibrinogen-binding MSCRAMM adhesin Fss2 [Enterococcus faecalis]EGO5175216.1 fibrinogen-binding MSCRAMM adhesin Fss2 [Enterococcus faecalis]EGO5845089.1 fibrinogen-binding MSCRAMM adhesin Fss2 [Enterococcus faecalis]
MKKKTFSFVMLSILLAQNFGFAVNAYAVTTTEAQTETTDTAKKEAELSNSTPSLPLATTTTSEMNQPTATTESQTTEASTTASSDAATPSEQQTTEDKDTSLNEKALPDVQAPITDELLDSMSLAPIGGTEYSQTEVHRELNTTPVTATFQFAVGNTGYAPGSVYTVQLPEHLGYSTVSGDVTGIGATWAVDAATKTLSITFNQRVSDTSFKVELKSYLTTEAEPLIKIETPGKNKKTYSFDLYEQVEPIQYNERTRTTGLDGEIFYNLDRTLTGNQTLELLTTETPGAVFGKQDNLEPQVFSYDVDINGQILPETQTLLTPGKDYTLSDNSLGRIAITVPNMNQQKAYSLSINRTIYLESASDYNYLYSQQYPTTKIGSISLKSTTGTKQTTDFTAKTSQTSKVIADREMRSMSYISFQSKGKYYVTIYGTLTETKVGQQIVLESTNGQEIKNPKFTAYGPLYENVKLEDYFDIKTEGGKLTLTATKDSYLRINISDLTMDFDKKDINLSLSTPVIGPNKAIQLVSDQYIEPISVVNPLNAETAWGNYDQNGAYSSRTTVSVMGSKETPIQNLEIKVKHPNYLSLRATKEIYFYYKLGTDYTVTPTSDGSVIKFTTPITNEIQIPIGFNYVPDSLPKDKSIPVDTIPITMSAEGLTPVDTTVTTNSKRGSERTLQSSKNQFLVNARNDSFDSLSVRTKIPAGADVLFDIYDVSNDQVDSIYPQYWDRGQYFDKPMTPNSPGYPTITFDENTNSYTFDFGKTNKRYIIEYKNANGWIDVPTLSITGTAKEPQSNNNEGSASVSVQNEALDILSATQAANPTLKNVTKTTVTTKNIDNKTHRVKNPTIELTPKGTTNAQIDLNSITVKGVPEDAYSLEKTTNGAKVIFKDYTLTENITIEYNTVSANAGQIYTETTIDSETLNQMSASKKKVTTAPITLKFSEGDAEGIVYLATATFYTHNVEDENQAIAKVSFELIDNVTHTATEFTTDEKGQYSFDAIMTGDYTLRVTNVPQEYSVDEEYLTGKAIKLVKGDNQLKIPLTKTIDHSRLQVKDSMIYVGDSWKPEENFVSATDKTGQDVPFEKITVSGQVDTSKVGVYPIVYSYEGKEETANVTVKPDQSKLEVKDTTIYVGDSWKPEDNFVSATDKTGQDVPFEKIDVQGTVNVDKIGDYEIVYKNGTKEAKAIVHVRDDSRLQVKDTTIYVGDSWKPEENFVSATDKTGQDVPFEKITVSGQVDNTKAGVYPIVYSYEGKEETAHVTVKPDQSKLEVKDTTIYVGDKWKPEDNFVSATDKTGQDVPFEKITVSGQVDNTKAGVYPIIYSYEGKEETAHVTVKPDQSKLEVKDTTIYVGDSWKPEDNFVSATDKTGQDVPFEKIDVQGTVNVDKIGDYEIVYKNGKKEAKAIVHVRDDSQLEVKDTTIYVGDSWKPEDNFVSATDKTGQDVPFEKITVSGQVDTSKAGVYPIVYSYEGKEETANVTVKPDQSKLEVKDTTIYVGDSWKPEDNFVSATDRDGHAISFDKVQVKGEVDTKKTGEYQISYTTEPVNETKPAVQSRLFAMFSNETPRQLTTVATVHVIDRNPTPLPDKNENNQTSSSTNQTTIKRSQYVTHIVKPDKQGRYPKTGEQTNGLYRVLGLVVLLIVIISGIVIKKKRK